jgi:hypothetical protein
MTLTWEQGLEEHSESCISSVVKSAFGRFIIVRRQEPCMSHTSASESYNGFPSRRYSCWWLLRPFT